MIACNNYNYITCVTTFSICRSRDCLKRLKTSMFVSSGPLHLSKLMGMSAPSLHIESTDYDELDIVYIFWWRQHSSYCRRSVGHSYSTGYYGNDDCGSHTNKESWVVALHWDEEQVCLVA